MSHRSLPLLLAACRFSGSTPDRDRVILWELRALSLLEFRLGEPSAMVFITGLVAAACRPGSGLEGLRWGLVSRAGVHLGRLMQDGGYRAHLPSTIATACLRASAIEGCTAVEVQRLFSAIRLCVPETPATQVGGMACGSPGFLFLPTAAPMQASLRALESLLLSGMDPALSPGRTDLTVQVPSPKSSAEHPSSSDKHPAATTWHTPRTPAEAAEEALFRPAAADAPEQHKAHGEQRLRGSWALHTRNPAAACTGRVKRTAAEAGLDAATRENRQSFAA